MTKISKSEYLAKVKLLTKEETERLLSRMGGKLDRRLEKAKLSKEEALAIQLELEDEQLQEWRKMMHSLKNKEKAK
jgi:N-acyl-L-homoserine lactone synthetase